LTSTGQGELILYLALGEIDTSYQTQLLLDSPFDVPAAPLSSGELLYLVQFDGPVQGTWRSALATAGVQFSAYYVPNFGYLVRMQPALVPVVQYLPHVYAVVEYKPAYKAASDLEEPGPGPLDLSVAAFSAGDVGGLTTEIAGWGGSVSEEVWLSARVAVLG
jgi:hypothetical protein